MPFSRLLRWASGLAALALFGLITARTAALDPPLLALQLAPTPEAFGGVLQRWQAPGIAVYRAHFALDFALLACYGLFGRLLARRGWVAWALPAAALCDAAENLLHLRLLARPEALDALVVAAAFGASVLKWLLILAFVAGLLAGLRRRRAAGR